MKNYVIGTLMVALLVLASLFYKYEYSSRTRFPIPDKLETASEDLRLSLFLFFSKDNCVSCLDVVEVLNTLPPHFNVTGIIPEAELADEKKFRGITGALFPLISSQKFNQYIPWYSPTLIGVAPNGEILFAIPGVPGQKNYLEDFLESLYKRINHLFLKEKVSKLLSEEGGRTC